jgi:hypothetical protein
VIRQRILESLAAWHRAHRPFVAPLVSRKIENLDCPSYLPSLGGQVLASRRDDGNLNFEPEPSPVGTHVRFSGPCVRKRCQYWSGNCQLGAIVSRVALQVSKESAITREDLELGFKCRIVQSCRWRSENGPIACVSCSSVDYFMDVKV